MLDVRIKKLDPRAVVPMYAHEGDAGFDFVAIEDQLIQAGETALVRTGLAFEIPAGYELQIRPRSGVSLHTALRVANAPGTIDSGYTGEVQIIMDNICAIWPGEDPEEHMGYDYTTAFDLSGDEVAIDSTTTCCTAIIRAGDKIAQGVIAPIVRAEFIEVDGLAASSRADAGFGSTGTQITEVYN